MKQWEIEMIFKSLVDREKSKDYNEALNRAKDEILKYMTFKNGSHGE